MLQQAVDWLLYSVIKMDSTTRLAETLNYIIYDTIKIMFLLFVMVFIAAFLRSYLPQDKMKKWLSKKRYGLENLLAAIFGAITPFCSCSSIPLFIGFIRSGIPLGVTFSFLVTSPLVNEYLVVLMFGFFGWKIAAAYVISGILLGFFSGIILGKMNLERYLNKDIALNAKSFKQKALSTMQERFNFSINESYAMVAKLWIWLIVGVGIGAIIHNYVPQELIQSAISRTGIFTIPVVVLLGVPMYGSCAAIVPIAVALFQKGIPLGTALAFMMAISALSLPEGVMLKGIMKLKLVLIFFAVVTAGIILTGYLFNFLQNILL
ncbi:MAG: permease [Nanoarchaeota archaeon]|nr:permease [Nanoarchaeota archaeon]